MQAVIATSQPDLDALFSRLARSRFRRRFALGDREAGYLHERGLTTVLEHGKRFIAERLAPAEPRNDGRQTPWRNHPVFVAQHATATCCRRCLSRWHGIPVGAALTAAEQDYMLRVIERWLHGRGARSAAC